MFSEWVTDVCTRNTNTWMVQKKCRFVQIFRIKLEFCTYYPFSPNARTSKIFTLLHFNSHFVISAVPQCSCNWHQFFYRIVKSSSSVNINVLKNSIPALHWLTGDKIQSSISKGKGGMLDYCSRRGYLCPLHCTVCTVSRHTLLCLSVNFVESVVPNSISA